MVSQADFFQQLGAPLANVRWSWGAVRASDGSVFIRVWQDREREHNTRWYTQITHNTRFASKTENLGHQERLRHVELVRGGAPCYLVMCEAIDIMARPRKIKTFDAEDLFVGGELTDWDGDTWIERRERVSALHVRLKARALDD